jgi:putative flippase GtrA
MPDMKWHIQFSRYVVVGLASNSVGYLLYILLTYFGMGHKSAMSLLYAVGVAQTFYFNRKWSFGHDGVISQTLVRYIAAYALGYVLNLVTLMILVDRLGWPHQWVQGAMIFLLAGMLFLLQRYWVFRTSQA